VTLKYDLVVYTALLSLRAAAAVMRGTEARKLLQQNNKNNKQQTAIDVAYGSAQHADRERVRETERERKKERKREHA
jgi:hypothetical protein